MHCALRSRIAVPLTKFASVLAGHDLVGSMSRVGGAGDNAAMESFFALLQKDVLDRRARATRQETIMTPAAALAA